jgi:hypothetical protein
MVEILRKNMSMLLLNTRRPKMTALKFMMRMLNSSEIWLSKYRRRKARLRKFW